MQSWMDFFVSSSQMSQFNTICRATANLRYMSHARDTTPVLGSYSGSSTPAHSVGPSRATTPKRLVAWQQKEDYCIEWLHLVEVLLANKVCWNGWLSRLHSCHHTYIYFEIFRVKLNRNKVSDNHCPKMLIGLFSHINHRFVNSDDYGVNHIMIEYTTSSDYGVHWFKCFFGVY